MRIIWVSALVVLQVGARVSAREFLFVGTRSSNSTTVGSTPSQGVYAARLDPDTGQLAPLGLLMGLDRAQWLEVHPRLPVLYAVAADGPDSHSRILSFSIAPDSANLRQLGSVDSGGRDATYLLCDVKSHTLLAANHGSTTGSTPPLEPGTVSTFEIQAGGALTGPIDVQHRSGGGPNPRRQRTAQVHSVLLDPTRQFVLIADLGTDEIVVYRFDARTRKLQPSDSAKLPPGSGPRHLRFHPDGHFLYVISELSAQVFVFKWNGRTGSLALIQTVSTYPPNYHSEAERSGAELLLAADGRHAYVSNRGDLDDVVVYDIEHQQGTMTEVQRLSAAGRSPIAMTLDASNRWLLVANEASGTVTEFAVDRHSGRLAPTRESLLVPRAGALVVYSR